MRLALSFIFVFLFSNQIFAQTGFVPGSSNLAPAMDSINQQVANDPSAQSVPLASMPEKGFVPGASNLQQMQATQGTSTQKPTLFSKILGALGGIAKALGIGKKDTEQKSTQQMAYENYQLSRYAQQVAKQHRKAKAGERAATAEMGAQSARIKALDARVQGKKAELNAAQAKTATARAQVAAAQAKLDKIPELLHSTSIADHAQRDLSKAQEALQSAQAEQHKLSGELAQLDAAKVRAENQMASLKEMGAQSGGEDMGALSSLEEMPSLADSSGESPCTGEYAHLQIECEGVRQNPESSSSEARAGLSGRAPASIELKSSGQATRVSN